jgi:hypothetical protein
VRLRFTNIDLKIIFVQFEQESKPPESSFPDPQTALTETLTPTFKPYLESVDRVISFLACGVT